MALGYLIIVAGWIVFALAICTSAYDESAEDLKEANEKKSSENEKPDQEHEIKQPNQAHKVYKTMPLNVWMPSEASRKAILTLIDDENKTQNQSNKIRQSKARKHY